MILSIAVYMYVNSVEVAIHLQGSGMVKADERLPKINSVVESSLDAGEYLCYITCDTAVPAHLAYAAILKPNNVYTERRYKVSTSASDGVLMHSDSQCTSTVIPLCSHGPPSS